MRRGEGFRRPLPIRIEREKDHNIEGGQAWFVESVNDGRRIGCPYDDSFPTSFLGKRVRLSPTQPCFDEYVPTTTHTAGEISIEGALGVFHGHGHYLLVLSRRWVS